ncbi:MAG: C25 family cysteine peptidase [bacterium]
MRSLAAVAVLFSLALGASVSTDLVVTPSAVSLAETDGYAVLDLSSLPGGTALAYQSAPGEPLLPWLSVNVVIPTGAAVEGITVVPLERRELGSYNLHPAQPMRPLSQLSGAPFVAPNPAAYASDEIFPAGPLVIAPAGNKSGWRIAGLLWCPFEYRPQSGRLTVITRARVEVRYKPGAVPVDALSESQRDFFASDVATLVANPEDVKRMAPVAVARDLPDLDVVIFTDATLAPALGGLRTWLQRKGYFTEIVRHDTLTGSGRDAPEKMRNLVRSLYAERGLKYVILGGDYQSCPVRYGYLPYSTYNVPADMYFGDIDGSWDANNNNRFGEMAGDSVDLFQDLYVGRLPLDNAAHADNFLKKDTLYELHPDTAYLDNILLPSEWLWQNIDYSGRIVNTNIARLLSGMSTWQVESALGMNSATVIAGLNVGRQHLHFAGHGSRTAFGSTFSTSNLASLNNVAKPTIAVTMACDCGWFDDANDCLGEQFINVTNGGAVATLFNARYGWGAPPCQGPNENLNCEFYRNYARGFTLGQSHGLARDFLRNESFSQMSTRWALYTNTLQGDPTMRMWRTRPSTLAVVAPDTIAASPQVLSVTVDCGDERAVGARVALTHLGQLLGRGVTDSRGIAEFPITAPNDSWTMELAVTAQDAQFWTQTVYAAGACPGPLVVLDHAWVDDPNGRLDPLEESDIYFTVRNLGAAPSDSATGYLSTLSPWVTIIDSVADYGAIASGDTAKGSAFRLAVARDCPHGHRAEMLLRVSDGTGTWHSQAGLTVGLPHPNGGLYGVLDTGNYVLSVPGNGGIGTTQWRGEGFGWVYTKNRSWTNSCLMHGGLVLGTDTAWVADNFYGAPAWQVCPQDFAVEESVRQVYPPEFGEKQFFARFTDADHPSPRSLAIDQRVYGGASLAHDDFIIYEWRIHNGGTDPVLGLHVGVACDFRTVNWNANDLNDYAGTDSARTLAYIKASPETTALGIRPIYPRGAAGWANCINNTAIADGFTKVEKMGFLDGTLRSTTGTTMGNWHAMASSGPYDIAPGDSQIVAFVLVGGRTVAEMQVNSDTAEQWYNPPTGASERGIEPARLVRSFAVNPRISSGAITIRYSLERIAPLHLELFDASGRQVGRYTHQPAGLSGSVTITPEGAGRGVYFLRVGDQADKVAIAR